MTEVVQPVNPEDPEGHGAGIPVEHYHFNILESFRTATETFKTRSGKEPRFAYVPEAYYFLLDMAVKNKLHAAGMDLPPENLGLGSLFGVLIVPIPGTCVTITHERVHNPIGDLVMPEPDMSKVN